jgi:hypothetical protein
MKISFRCILTFMIVLFMTTSMLSTNAEINYDVTHDDKKGDVRTIGNDGLLAIVQGHDDIDILKIKSSKLNIKQNIVLEMTVAGIIVKSENFTYSFYINDQDMMVYTVFYQNGMCFGSNTDDYSSGQEDDVLIASGAGTDTLMVTIPIDNLGAISSYDFSGNSMEMESLEDTFNIFMDEVPESPFPWPDGPPDGMGEPEIFIVEPTDGGTVYKTVDIDGITDTDSLDIINVEVQIDSKSADGWKDAESSDGWSSWSYTWDTTKVSDGMHTINARASDGSDYYHDSITVYVDQKTAVSPETMEVPTFQIGDRYVYDLKMTEGAAAPVEGAEMTGSMTFEVVDIDKITVNGIEYEAYVFDVSAVQDMKAGFFSSKSTMDGTIWMRVSDLAIVKEEMEQESEGIGSEGDYSSHEDTTYDPPASRIGFPISVSEKGFSISNGTSRTTETFDGDTETTTDTFERKFIFECLRTETVQVPAGTFDTFLIRFEEDYDYGSDDGDWDEIDSDGDGWTDDDEEMLGTDPNDPSDYPTFADTDGDGWSDDDEEMFGTDPEDPEDHPTHPPGDPYGTDGGNGGTEEYSYEEVSAEEVYYTDYSVEYYSPEIGYWVKVEYFDMNRDLMMSMELVSYKHGNKSYTAPDSDILILAVTAIIIIAVIAFAVTKRRKKAEVPAVEGMLGEPRVIQQIPMTSPTVPQPQPIVPCQNCRQPLYMTSQIRPVSVKCYYCSAINVIR